MDSSLRDESRLTATMLPLKSVVRCNLTEEKRLKNKLNCKPYDRDVESLNNCVA